MSFYLSPLPSQVTNDDHNDDTSDESCFLGFFSPKNNDKIVRRLTDGGGNAALPVKAPQQSCLSPLFRSCFLFSSLYQNQLRIIKVSREQFRCGFRHPAFSFGIQNNGQGKLGPSNFPFGRKSPLDPCVLCFFFFGDWTSLV